MHPWKQSFFFENRNISEEKSWKKEEKFDVETWAKENFSENSPKENPTCAEEDKEKEEKEQAEADFTITVAFTITEKSVIVIDWYVW